MRKIPLGRGGALNFEEENGFPFDDSMYQLSFNDMVRNGFLICKNTMRLTS